MTGPLSHGAASSGRAVPPSPGPVPGPVGPVGPPPAPSADPAPTATLADLSPSRGSAVPPGVAQALARLTGLDGRPVGEHVEVFDGVHRLLQDALATLDEA